MYLNRRRSFASVQNYGRSKGISKFSSSATDVFEILLLETLLGGKKSSPLSFSRFPSPVGYSTDFYRDEKTSALHVRVGSVCNALQMTLEAFPETSVPSTSSPLGFFAKDQVSHRLDLCLGAQVAVVFANEG